MATTTLPIPSNSANSWTLPTIETVQRTFSIYALRAGSYLIDPICKSHECFRTISIIDAIHPDAYKIANLARKFFIAIGMLACGFAALFTTIPGIGLRYLACRLQKEPYIHLAGEIAPQPLYESFFDLLTWNVCGISAGHAITDGGVIPFIYRRDYILNSIIRKAPAVVCLYEVFDANDAFYFYERLKKNYTDFYFCIGPRAVGVSSGMFVASKYKIAAPEFTAFPKEMLVGRTKNAEKGVFAFDIQSNEKTFAHIFSAHLQHSEECAFPTPEEKEARAKEMGLVIERMNERHIEDSLTILNGDLNMDTKEYDASSWRHNFYYKNAGNSWGGSRFCASLVGNKGSDALNLDYALLYKNKNHQNILRAELWDDGFKGLEFRRSALSDHKALYTEIRVENSK